MPWIRSLAPYAGVDRCLRAALSAAAVALTAAALGADEPPAGRPPQVITAVREFWEIPLDARAATYPVRLQFTVCYYDPGWNLLWAEGDDGISFIYCPKRPLSLAAGQRIEVEGSMSPAVGLSLENAKIRVVAEKALLQAGRWTFHGELGEATNLRTEMVSVEGFVNRQSTIDETHVLLDMTVGALPVQARVLLSTVSPVPQCASAFVRVQGVMVPNLTPAGQLSALALWVARPEDVKVTGWLRSDARFQSPATPIEHLLKAPGDQLVKIGGTAWAQEPGHSLTIRDGTGQATVITGQSDPIKSGDGVEAIGYPAVRGTEITLREGLYRSVGSPADQPPPGGARPKLRLADQVLDLGVEQAAEAYPVQIFGVVTWADFGAGFIYVNDSSGGIRVVGGKTLGVVPVQGQTVQVEGFSAAGEFAPVVKATTIKVTGSLALPEARAVTLEQALTGIEEGQWIEMNGFVRDVRREGKWECLDLTSSGGSFTACLPPSGALAPLRGSVVMVRGVCSAVANERRQLVGIRLWVPSEAPEFLQVVQPAPADPFSVPVRSVASLRQFSTLEAFNRRVHVAGTVLYHAAGRYLYLQDGTESLEVLSQEDSSLAPGDRIEAVGFPGWQAGAVVLREAVCRRVGRGEEPAPIELDASRGPSQDLDGHLVRTTGLLLDTVAREDEVRLMIQMAGAVFEALLERRFLAEPEAAWEPGSRLTLTGVYRVQYDEYTRPRTFQVQLRSPQDIRVLSRPSWWTAARALTVVGILVFFFILGTGWVVTLRRRVRQQTAQIREQVERQARLEAELLRSSKLESLGILAGGIAHDFNNLLTVIMGNLTLAKLDAESDPAVERWLREAEQGVMRARDLTLQLLTFAKGGDPVRKAVALAEVVRETAEFALHGSAVRCDYDFVRDLWPADVDKGQISQVVQNIVINAMQAMPKGGVIRIGLRNAVVELDTAFDLAAGRYLKLTIADAGVGINPEHLPRIFDPYFTTKATGMGLGLATVYSVVKKHAGRIEVRSTPGEGTTFDIWLPAAQKPPSVSPLVDAQLVPQGGRVLLMDDEEAIRRSAAALLQRIGMEVVAVEEGNEVLREYTAARKANQPYDLVILDLTVPGGMGGRETFEKLRQVDPQVRALVSSGYSSDPVLAQYRAHGFLGMVPKPYDIAELSRAIQAALKGRTP